MLFKVILLSSKANYNSHFYYVIYFITCHGTVRVKVCHCTDITMVKKVEKAKDCEIVDDKCWRRNMLVTSLKLIIGILVKILSPIFEKCYQVPSATSWCHQQHCWRKIKFFIIKGEVIILDLTLYSNGFIFISNWFKWKNIRFTFSVVGSGFFKISFPIFESFLKVDRWLLSCS